MATVLNAYKTGSHVDAYSKDGANDDPVFPFPPNDFDGDNGQTRDIELFLRNDGTTDLRQFSAVPFDKAALGRETWMKVALSEIGLDSAVAGDPVSLPDLLSGGTNTFWMRITVPSGTAFASVTDLTPRLQSFQYE